MKSVVHSFLLAMVLGFLVSTCGSDKGSSGDSCTTKDDCGSPLYCATMGSYAGHCAADCDTAVDCQEKVGDDHFCYVTTCVKSCDTDDQCPSAMKCLGGGCQVP